MALSLLDTLRLLKTPMLHLFSHNSEGITVPPRCRITHSCREMRPHQLSQGKCQVGETHSGNTYWSHLHPLKSIWCWDQQGKVQRGWVGAFYGQKNICSAVSSSWIWTNGEKHPLKWWTYSHLKHRTPHIMTTRAWQSYCLILPNILLTCNKGGAKCAPFTHGCNFKDARLSWSGTFQTLSET